MHGSNYKPLSLWFFLHLYKFLGWLRKKLETAENFIKVKYENRLFAKEDCNLGNVNTAFHEENEINESKHENNFSDITKLNTSDTQEKEKKADNSMKQFVAFRAVEKDTATKRSLEKSLEASKEETLENTGTKRALSESLTSSSAIGIIVTKHSLTENSTLHAVEKDTVTEIITEINNKDLHLLMKRYNISEELMEAISSETLRSQFNVLENRLCNNGLNSPFVNIDGIVNVCNDFLTTLSKVFRGTELRAYGLIIQDYAIIIELVNVDETTKSDKKTKTLRIFVVSSVMFEEAMRRSQIQTIELTYTNVFPSDCRMFIGVPVYKDGYLNRKDQL